MKTLILFSFCLLLLFPDEQAIRQKPDMPATGTEPDSVLAFPISKVDVGVIAQNGLRVDFEARNISGKPLCIRNCTTACGCDVPEWSKEPILPNDITHFIYLLDTHHRPGAFIKTMLIDAGAKPKVIRFQGVISQDTLSPTAHFSFRLSN